MLRIRGTCRRTGRNRQPTNRSMSYNLSRRSMVSRAVFAVRTFDLLLDVTNREPAHHVRAMTGVPGLSHGIPVLIAHRCRRWGNVVIYHMAMKHTFADI